METFAAQTNHEDEVEDDSDQRINHNTYPQTGNSSNLQETFASLPPGSSLKMPRNESHKAETTTNISLPEERKEYQLELKHSNRASDTSTSTKHVKENVTTKES